MVHHRGKLFLKIVHCVCEYRFELVLNAQQVRRVLEKTEKSMLRHCPYQLFEIWSARVIATPDMPRVDHLEGEKIMIDHWEA